MDVIAQHDDEVTVAPGALKLVVLEMLNASARKESVVSFGITKFLKIDASNCRRISPLKVFARTVP